MPAGDAPDSLQRAARPQKRSFSLGGHRTSISIEAPFWEALQSIATHEDTSLAALVAIIDKSRGDAGLSSAVRVWILDYYRTRTLPSPD
jgi:predicted DNA-binding ribbon-helix-helix protein